MIKPGIARGAGTLDHPRKVVILFFDSKETNQLINLLILQILLTENRKLKTENGIIGRPVAAITIADRENAVGAGFKPAPTFVFSG